MECKFYKNLPILIIADSIFESEMEKKASRVSKRWAF